MTVIGTVLLLCISTASATLTIYHGIVFSQGNILYERVQGVAVLNLRSQSSHFFDCETSDSMPQDLTWIREGDKTQVFPTDVRSSIMTLRLLLESLTPAADDEELGVFICVNTVTDERLSINITGGATALCPVKSSETVIIGCSIDLRVYADADPPLQSGEILWYTPSGELVMNGSRLSLHDSEKLLRIANTSLEDSGTYRIDIRRLITGTIFSTLATTTIELNVILELEIDITKDTIYTILDSTVPITATVHTSRETSLTIRWYYNGDLLNTTNNPQYSLDTDGMNTYTLIIVNVDMDNLGRYEVMVTTEEGMSQNATVWLMLAEPPIATAIPAFRRVPENVHVRFQCLVNGTESTVVWWLAGNLPLPNGVVQDGSDLIISQTHRDQAGVYECNVANEAGTATSTATLSVYYPLIATITDEGSGRVSIDDLLQVVAGQGDPPPTFSCSSDGIPTPTVTWGRLDGGVALPSGVARVQVPSSEARLDLEWKRPLEYTDSGLYPCNAVNSNESYTAVLDLLVRHAPTITSIFPSAPVNSSSSLSFTAPVGYNGPVVTCTAIGWPAPMIMWLKSGVSLTGRIYSTRRESSAFVSATLIWQDGFLDSDVGEYSCVVQANDTVAVNIRNITLESSVNSPPVSSPLNCSVKSLTSYFQIRVLNTDCLDWDLDTRQQITRRFMDTILSAVSAECESCLLIPGDLVINTLQCSSQVDRAAVFRGIINTEENRMTTDIFCALYNWQQNGPLVLVNDELHLVDQSCSVRLESPADPECSAPLESPTILIISVGSAVGAVVVVTFIVLITVCVCIYREKRKRSKMEVYISAEPRTVYDRTYPNPSSGAILTDYNDQPSSNPPTPRSELAGNINRHYSGLSYPSSSPLSRLSQEFELNVMRNNSRTLLLDDTDTPSARQEGNNRTGLPDIYQISVDDANENVTHLIDSNSKVPGPRESYEMDATSPFNNPEYEAIEEKHPFHSSSSSKLLGQDRTRASIGKAVSTGQIRLNNTSSFNGRDDDSKKNYSHLDRGDSFTPTQHRKNRGQQISSLVVSNPPSLPSSPAPNRDKRPTFPGYSSYSPKLQESPLTETDFTHTFNASPPCNSSSPLVSLRTADYEEIQSLTPAGNSQDMLISHDYSEPHELEQRRPSFPQVPSKAVDTIPPYSVVNKHQKDSLEVGIYYGEPTALDNQLPSIRHIQSDSHSRVKNAISPYSQVRNAEIDKSLVDSDEYNQPTALDRQLPEIPSYSTISDDKPQSNVTRRQIQPYSQISNTDSIDLSEYGQPTALDRQLPEIPSTDQQRPLAKPVGQRSIRKPKNTIPPYSQVSKPKKKDKGLKADNGEPTMLIRQLPEIPSSSDVLKSADVKRKSTRKRKKAIQPYSQVSNIDIATKVDDHTTLGQQQGLGHNKNLLTPKSPRMPIPPYSQVSNDDIDNRKKKISCDSLFDSEPSPYSEPVRRSIRGSEASIGSASGLILSISSPPTRRETHIGLATPVVTRSPSPYSEPVKSINSHKSEASFTFSVPVKEEHVKSGANIGFDVSGVKFSGDFSDSEPSPYSEPVTSAAVDTQQKLPVPYSEPVGNSSHKPGHIDSVTPYSEPVSSPATDRPASPAPYSEPLGNTAAKKRSTNSLTASPYCEPKRSRNARKK